MDIADGKFIAQEQIDPDFHDFFHVFARMNILIYVDYGMHIYVCIWWEISMGRCVRPKSVFFNSFKY